MWRGGRGGKQGQRAPRIDKLSFILLFLVVLSPCFSRRVFFFVFILGVCLVWEPRKDVLWYVRYSFVSERMFYRSLVYMIDIGLLASSSHERSEAIVPLAKDSFSVLVFLNMCECPQI